MGRQKDIQDGGQSERCPEWVDRQQDMQDGGRAKGRPEWVDRQKDIQDRWIDNKSPWTRPFGASPKEPTRLELPNKVLSLSTY